LLGGRYDIEEAPSAERALELLTVVGGDFDVAIVELVGSARLEGALAGTSAIRALRRARPALGIVAHDRRPGRHAATEAIGAGATAYVAKSSSADALAQAVDSAAEAEKYVDPAAGNGSAAEAALTRRQREILQLFADGNSTAQAARRLGLSAETVRTHTKAILSRLEARDRAHAVAIALRGNLID
jgi:DNA-binding NarL/FixJ family response regulator